MKVCVLAEYYPSPADPVSGIWAHRQAIAAREAGAEVRVLALERPIPPMRTVRALLRPRPDTGPLRDFAASQRRIPRHTTLDGIEVEYVRFLSPPRPLSYGGWDAWAGPALRHAISGLERRFEFDLLHAHYATPAGRIALHWRDERRPGRRRVPLCVSVHGVDLITTPERSRWAREAVSNTLAAAEVVMCNSRAMLERCEQLAGPRTAYRVVHLGTDVPAAPPERRPQPTLVTVAHLVERKHHADVLRAMALASDELPALRYLVIGDGPEREAIGALAAELGLSDRVDLRGELGHREALQEAWSCHLFVMPASDEAFGVAYIEAMAGGLPAVGLAGEGGPEEIAALGGGMVRVPPRDPEALAQTLRQLLGGGRGDRRHLRSLGGAARRMVDSNFTWPLCGARTVEAYGDAIAERHF